MTSSIRTSPRHTGTVIAVRNITPRMRRITVHAPTMAGVVVDPAQDIEVFLHADDGRRVKRRYTIRGARPASGELDLDVLLHGAGPGSAWAAGARPGDGVQFQGPRGKLRLTSAQWHLLVGDESAIPAIASICEALPPAEPAVAVVEVRDAGDETGLGPNTRVHWVHRGVAEPGYPDLLTEALRTVDVPTGSGHAYLMGETRAMVALRPLVHARGIDPDAVFVKGYWNLGRPDRLAGRSPPAAG